MSYQENQLTEIADAIREKDGTIEPIKAIDFADRIKAIPSGCGIDSINEIQLPEIFHGKAFPSVVYSKLWDCFFIYVDDTTGTWKVDKQSGEITKVSNKIYTTWFISSVGEVFCSEANIDESILHFNGTSFDVVFTGSTSVYDRWFESSSGDLFVSSTSGTVGILHWDGTAFVSVYATGNNWQYWLERSNSDVFVSSPTSNSIGILHWDGTAFVQVYSTGYDWRNWFESSSSDLFVSSASGTVGILRWNGTAFVSVYDVAGGYQYWFESSNGDVFVSSSFSSDSAMGILHWDGTAFVSVYATGNYWEYWFESSSGNVFVSSSRLGYSYGILHWNGTSFVSVYATGNYWRNWFESSTGNVFVSSGNSSYNGILHWNNTTFVQVHTVGYAWQYWYESSGEIFVSSAVEAQLAAMRWTGTAFSLNNLSQIKGSYNIWRTASNGRVYAASSRTWSLTSVINIYYATFVGWRVAGTDQQFSAIATSLTINENDDIIVTYNSSEGIFVTNKEKKIIGTGQYLPYIINGQNVFVSKLLNLSFKDDLTTYSTNLGGTPDSTGIFFENDKATTINGNTKVFQYLYSNIKFDTLGKAFAISDCAIMYNK